MYKFTSCRICSIVLILSMIISGTAFADNVFVAGAPTNNLASNNGLAGSSVLGSMQSVQGAQTIYPGSIDAHDQTKTVDIKSPAANKANMAGANGERSAVITNGFAVPEDTNHQTPTAVDITSPGAHQAGIKNGSVSGTSSVYGPDNMNYSAPNSNGASGAGTNTSQGAGTDYPFNQSVTANNGVQTSAAASLTEQKTGLADPVITSDAAIVINGTTNQYYYQKNAVSVFPPAGLTTLLTGYLALQAKGIDDVLVVNATAVTGLESGANTVGLRAGDTITLKDALHAMYIKSACDAANVIAENIAGSQAAFVALMNQTAKSWGTISTNFANCNGLNNDAQVTTAYDMALIMNNITNNAVLNYVMSQSKYTLPATAHRKALTITTKNTILTPGTSNYYAGITCSRLGYTSKAKYTMGSLLMYKGQKIIAITLHSNGSQFVDTKRMFNFGKTVVDKLGLNGAATNQATTQAVQATQTTQTAANGDTAGAWQQDATGWMFIKSDGQKAVNQWIQSNGKRYCIDQTGYMITGWREFSNGNVYYFDTTSGEQKYNTWVNTSTGAYFLQADGTLAKATKGQQQTISTPVGNYVIDDTGKALRKAN